MIKLDDQKDQKRDVLGGSKDHTKKCPFIFVDNCVKPVDKILSF